MLKLICAASVLVATAALAQPAPTRRASLNNDPNQIVCVNERVTGSRVSQRRVCRTRQEWDDYQKQSREVVNEVQNFKPVLCNQPGEGTRNVC